MNDAIQAYLREVSGKGRQVERIGPFIATFSRSSSNPYLNYAIPEQGAEPSSQDVADLIAAYRGRNLAPRLEYIPETAPLVEEDLLAQGFVAEGCLALMVYRPETAQEQAVPQGIELVVPTTDEELRGLLIAQNEAYNEGPPSEQDVRERRAFLESGGIAVYAYESGTGEPVGGGVCTIPMQGLTELAGVGVRRPFRRRGIAGALTARLVQEALAQGIKTVFLMAAGEDEARIYERVGFTTIARILHISLPR